MGTTNLFLQNINIEHLLLFYIKNFFGDLG